MDYIIKAINNTKRYSLKNKLFAQLGVENDEGDNYFLTNTEVCWLYKNECV